MLGMSRVVLENDEHKGDMVLLAELRDLFRIVSIPCRRYSYVGLAYVRGRSGGGDGIHHAEQRHGILHGPIEIEMAPDKIGSMQKGFPSELVVAIHHVLRWHRA